MPAPKALAGALGFIVKHVGSWFRVPRRALARGADRLAVTAGRYSDEAVAAARRSGASARRLDEVRTMPKGSRPDPSTYLPARFVDEHLSAFRESGAVRFYSGSSFDKYGTLGPPGGTYAIPRSQFDDVMARTGGDLGKVETELGLEPGALTDGSTRVAYVKPDDLDNLRMPSGNEAGANSNWLPGGYTSGGVPEAAIDVPPGTPFTPINLRRP